MKELKGVAVDVDNCSEGDGSTDTPLTVKIDTPPLPEQGLIYQIRDKPPFPILISSSIQHIILALPGALTCSSIVADVACVPYDHSIRAKLFCATLFMCGIATIMQTAFGVRLPIFQGSSSSFIVPLLALRSSPDGKCEGESKHVGSNSTVSNSSTTLPLVLEFNDEQIYSRLQKMSGALMLASVAEICIGGFGAFRVLSKFIGPITIATTISLIGFTLCKLPLIYGRPQFAIAFGCMFLVLVFILHMQRFRIPLPKCGKKEKDKPRKHFAIFQLLPLMTAVVIMWVLTWVLTILGVFTDDKNDPEFLARADAKIDLIHRSPWFQLSYPGMFGPPQRDWALTTSFLVAVFASMVESVGDYYAAQKVCEVGPPPNEAISRGIFMEGIASLISGAMGVGHATTSYSGNISVLTLTQTASRTVMYVAGGILIGMSLLGKLGAAVTTVPNPLLGGVSVIIVGSLISIGLSNLNRVDLKSTRNMLVVGVSLGAGIILPEMVLAYPEVFQTGHNGIDQMVHVLLGTPMFVGALVATILDNTSPGSSESRGITDSTESPELPQKVTEGIKRPDFHRQDVQNPYIWTCYPALARRLPFLRYIPFMPK